MSIFQNYNEIISNPTIRVIFRDNRDIDLATIATGCITITGPNAFANTPTFIDGSAVAVNTTDARADFRLAGVSFGVAQNGVYTVNSVGGIVADSAGNTLDAAILGSFDVLIYSETLVKKQNVLTDTAVPFPFIARDSSSYDNIDFYPERTAREAFDDIRVVDTAPSDGRGHVYTSFAGEIAGTWLSLSFGREVEISRLVLKTPTDANGFIATRYYKDFQVQISNDDVFDPDNGWTTVYTQINEPTWNLSEVRNYDFPAVYAKHVRVLVDDNHGNNFVDTCVCEYWGAYTLS